ncbi:MAG TPA: hypothetical protein DCF45_12510 [Gammaproteobacteria bacterium]|nr:hypothetical protein [Gammaproteobacteria bacterium]
MSSNLPVEFSDLEWLTDKWLLETENERHRARLASEPMELQRVYDTLLPRMEPICEYLDQYPLSDLPWAAHNLMTLAFVFMEVSCSVEMFGGSPEVPFGFEPNRWIVHC